MTVFIQQARVKPDSVPEVEAGITRMISALDAQAPVGVRYAYTKLRDGVTFMALLELADGVDNPLPGIEACQQFQANLARRWIDQPDSPTPHPLRIVGSYDLFA